MSESTWIDLGAALAPVLDKLAKAFAEEERARREKLSQMEAAK